MACGCNPCTISAPGVYEILQHPWTQTLESYIRAVFQRYSDVRNLGSCFEHQIVANTILPNSGVISSTTFFAYGFSHQVYAEKCPLGRKVGIYEVQLDQEFVCTFPVLEELHEGKLRLQMMHGDWVLVPPRTPISKPSHLYRPHGKTSEAALFVLFRGLIILGGIL